MATISLNLHHLGHDAFGETAPPKQLKRILYHNSIKKSNRDCRVVDILFSWHHERGFQAVVFFIKIQ